MQWDDPFRQGKNLASWSLIDGADLSEDITLEADVVIVGSGAGGGVAAEILSRSGRKVILIEEGSLKSSGDFRLKEAQAYLDLYQEGMTRSTQDGAICILQGRTVGGSTTVNWTSSFRTPRETLGYWGSEWGLEGCGVEEMAPWFAKMEQRLSIEPWLSPNSNNQVLDRGCEALGWAHAPIPRNVKGCWNLGACGLGCPTNAKQSMLVTTIPAALDRGARLLHRVRVQELIIRKERVIGLVADMIDRLGRVRPFRVTIHAQQCILSAGAIGSPAVLLRSEGIPDPYRLIGTRTFLHPSVFGFAEFAEPIEGYQGAPQSSYSDHFQWRDGVEGPMGFKLEATPMHPVFASVIMRGHGLTHWQRMQNLPHMAGTLALLRDGFHPESTGGRVSLGTARQPVLDYRVGAFEMDGVRRAYLAMAEMFFAAGAQKVNLGHSDSEDYDSWAKAREAIAKFRYEPLRLRLGSAHVMGGCRMGSDPKRSVVNTKGRYHHLENLYVFDGSLFPTSVGANPQLSIYALVAKCASELAASS